MDQKNPEILWIHVPCIEGTRRQIMVLPLGLPALANLLQDSGISCRINHIGIEQTLGSSLESLLATAGPRAFFFSLHWNQQCGPVTRAAKAAKKARPDVPLFLGGLTATVFAEQLLALPYVDGVIRGDGEVPALELAKRLRDGSGWQGVPNLIYRDGKGKIRENRWSFALTEQLSATLRHGDLKTVLRHAREYMAAPLYADFSEGTDLASHSAHTAYLNAGRGCTAPCPYCGGSAFGQGLTCRRKGLILYPQEKLLQDARDGWLQGAKTMRTSFDPPRARPHLRQWFRAIGQEGLPLRLIYDLWALPDDELIDAIATDFEPGSVVVFSPECGEESLRAKLRGRWGSYSNDGLVDAIKKAEDAGLKAHCFFSAGLPGEGEVEVEKSAQLIATIRGKTSAGVSVTPMYIDPGSQMWAQPRRWGISLVRAGLDDFVQSRGLDGGPGYRTEAFDEQGILAACNTLLDAAGLPAINAGAQAARPSPTGAAFPSAGGEPSPLVLLVGTFCSMNGAPKGQDQGGFADTLGVAPYSLAHGYLKTFAEADPQLRSRYRVEIKSFCKTLQPYEQSEEFSFSQSQLEELLAAEAAVYAFSAYCWNENALAHATGEIKKRRPEALVLVGGRATEAPEELLARLPAVDALIVGEGERAFAQILGQGLKELGAVPGVFVRGAFTPGETIDDLDAIPSPYLQGAVTPKTGAMMMELSRGCAHQCGYCTWSANKSQRYFSKERIAEEVRWAVKQGHRHITVNDSALNYSTAQLEQNVAAIRRADPEGKILWTYNLRHESLNDDQIGILSSLPTHMVLLGIETLSPEPMKEVGRDPVQDPEGLKDKMGQLARSVRPPVVSIVLGLPKDTLSSFEKTLDTLLEWTDQGAAATVLVSLLQVYRGSTLWRRREQLGLRFAEGVPYLLESSSWSRKELARAKALLIGRMERKGHSKLKAAEGIALSESQGGLDPWLKRRRLAELLAPWPKDAQWQIQAFGPDRLRGDRAILVCQKATEKAWVTLKRKGAKATNPKGSRLFTLETDTKQGDNGAALLELLAQTLRQGEQAIALRRK